MCQLPALTGGSGAIARRGGSLEVSRVTRRAGSEGRSLIVTHYKPLGKLSVISCLIFLICRMGMVITPPFIRLWEDYLR